MNTDTRQDEEETAQLMRQVPQSDLDFNLMTTDPVWGSEHVSPQLQKMLSETYEGIDKYGNVKYSEHKLWGVLNYYTRDIRLGNLDRWLDIPYVEFYLNLAGDFLQSKMIRPFLIALSRAATRIELSQSKGGFLRRRMSTVTKESFSKDMFEPPKKNIFGGNKKEW